MNIAQIETNLQEIEQEISHSVKFNHSESVVMIWERKISIGR